MTTQGPPGTQTPGCAEIEVTPQHAYALDCERRPTYHDGTPRKQWSALCEIAQWSWSRHNQKG